jgi:hypothetical protein
MKVRFQGVTVVVIRNECIIIALCWKSVVGYSKVAFFAESVQCRWDYCALQSLKKLEVCSANVLAEAYNNLGRNDARDFLIEGPLHITNTVRSML